MSHVDPPDLRLWPTMRNLYPLWWAQWRLVGFGLACALVSTGLSLLIPIIVQRTIDNAIDGGDQLAARPVPRRDPRVRDAPPRRQLHTPLRDREGRDCGRGAPARMLYDAYLSYPRAFYDRHATGEVISRATNDIYPVRYFIGWGVVQALQSMMMLVGAAIVLAHVNARLALYAALSMPPIAVLTYVSHTGCSRSRGGCRRKRASHGGVGRGGRRDRDGPGVRPRGRRARPLRRARRGREGRDDEPGGGSRPGFLPGLIFLPTLGIAAVLLFGGRDAIAGNLTIGEFTLFVTLLLQLVWPLEALGWIINLGQRASAAASRSFAWLDGIEPLPEPARPRRSPTGRCPSHRGRPLPLRDGRRGARGGSTSRSRPARSWPSAAPTGAGKTSLLNLLPRFYDPTAGTVLFGGVDARDVAIAELRRSVAIVTQKPVLFSVPLRDNLLAARPDADWADVLDACEAAGVAGFVDDLPDGYDTLIGERGVNLSGGQRQRVALARALVAGARVIVLDDPMSAVDTETERHLVENLRPAVAGRTVLVSGQRLRPSSSPTGRSSCRTAGSSSSGLPAGADPARVGPSPSSSATRSLAA